MLAIHTKYREGSIITNMIMNSNKQVNIIIIKRKDKKRIIGINKVSSKLVVDQPRVIARGRFSAQIITEYR